VGSGVSDLIFLGGVADLGSLAGTCTLRHPWLVFCYQLKIVLDRTHNFKHIDK